jgi:SAM-dependent methyltransferase
VPVLDLGHAVLTGRFVRPDEQDPLGGPLQLVLCHGSAQDHCGLLQLRHSYPLEEMYGPTYGYRSSNNRTMVDHLRAKIGALVARVQPTAGDAVLDIGCNDGTTLRFYDGLGLSRVGVDPSSARFRHEFPDDVRLVVDFFSGARLRSEVGDLRFKIVTSLAMFYDLEDPLSFMREVTSVLAPDGVWEFEQHYMPTMLRRCAYDSVCHEHISYYALRQIKWMTDRCGLKIIGLTTNDINGGSFSVTAALKDSRFPEATAPVRAMLADEQTMALETLNPYRRMARDVAEHRSSLRRFLADARAQGKLVLGYGASTKGNVVLQYCGISTRELPAIAEKYPLKYGLVTPGTRIPIVPEADAHARGPAYLLVLPWYFRDELIEREMDYLRRGGTLVFVLPNMERVSLESQRAATGAA